jgi:hypothetical protein
MMLHESSGFETESIYASHTIPLYVFCQADFGAFPVKACKPAQQ